MRLTITTSTLALLLLSSTPYALAKPGGRCSGDWNDSTCICLDRNACIYTYQGRAEKGSTGNWPCPSDPSNVQGCYIVNHCPGFGADTSCQWAETCGGLASPLPSKDMVLLFFMFRREVRELTNVLRRRPGLSWRQRLRLLQVQPVR